MISAASEISLLVCLKSSMKFIDNQLHPRTHLRPLVEHLQALAAPAVTLTAPVRQVLLAAAPASPHTGH